ncbi:hypothetical protein O3C98_00120, partial [Staphylococcus aureus]
YAAAPRRRRRMPSAASATREAPLKTDQNTKVTRVPRRRAIYVQVCAGRLKYCYFKCNVPNIRLQNLLYRDTYSIPDSNPDDFFHNHHNHASKHN